MPVLEYADTGRLNDLCNTAHEYVQETTFGLTPSRKNSVDLALRFIYGEDSDIIYTTSDGELSSYALVSCGYDGYEEKFGYIIKFYVRAPFRGTSVARELFSEMVEWFDSRGCDASFATSTAMIGRDRAFQNLASKYGYEVCGPTMMRSK